MTRLLSLWLGKLLLLAARLRGGGGSALPGLAVEKIHPALLPQQVARLGSGCILVTGTNGKTTTSKMLTTALEAEGLRVLSNRSGSNMVRGLLSAVIEHSDWWGRLDYDIAVFEVDEPNMEAVARATDPQVILVLNLHRDQLDRYGELERTAELIGAGLPMARSVVLNADDPLVAGLAAEAGGDVRWFGGSESVRSELPDDANLLGNGPLSPAAVGVEGLQVCLGSAGQDLDRQTINVRIGDHELEATLRLPGVFNAYNAVAALATLDTFGLDAVRALAAVAATSPAFGRGETISVDGRRLLMLLVKNPSSFSQVIRTQLAAAPPSSVLIVINDNFADGRDISWLWDVDFERLAGCGHTITVAGLRGTDLALRLKYAGVEATTVDDSHVALRDLIDALAPDDLGFVVPTYTAMLDLRGELARTVDLEEIWE